MNNKSIYNQSIMINTNRYTINQQWLNDIKCEHNIKKRLYNQYCKTCKKNICIWCKGHKSHETINFDSIEPDQEKFEEIEKSISKMKSIKSKIKEKYSKISRFKEYIDKLIKLIDDAFEKLKEIENTFESHFKFNEQIFNAYKEDKRNYYILINFNSLDFNFEIDYLKNDSTFQTIENYINNINGIKTEKKTNMMNTINRKNNDIKISGINKINPNLKNEYTIKYDEDKNMWISEKYCKNWGLREAIREFIQNQYDGVIAKIESKKNLKVVKIGEKYTINGINQYLEYDFMKINEEKIYGKIRYNKYKKKLSISNEGELFLADFLLGGSKEELSNPDIIGVFGEGMKLAILALCRLEKNVTIISSDKLYSFTIKEDFHFITNSQPQKCLHCKIGKYNNSDMENKINVIIENINEDEWGNEIQNFLWLLGKDIEIFISLDKNNIEVRQIIYENYIKNKIFVKGIFVQFLEEKNKDDKDDEYNLPGFNAFLKLDRDRNCIQSQSELKLILSKIISFTFNKNVDYLRENQLKTGNAFIRTEYGFEKSDGKGSDVLKSGLSTLTKNIIYCLQKEKDVFSYYELRNNLSKESIEIIWNELDSNPNYKNKQPVYNINDVMKFIHEKKLPDYFYPFYSVSYELMKVLEKYSLYQTIENKFEEYVTKAFSIEPGEEHKKALEEIYVKIKIIISDFN